MHSILSSCENASENGRTLLDSISEIPSLQKKLQARLGVDAYNNFFLQEKSDVEFYSILKNFKQLKKCLVEIGMSATEGKRCRKALVQGELLFSYLPTERQLAIVRQLVEDLPLFYKYHHIYSEQTLKDHQINNKDTHGVQWATLATTPPVVNFFSSHKDAALRIQKLDILGIENFIEKAGEKSWCVKAFGCRISFAFFKQKCMYKEKKGGCRYCNLSLANTLTKKVEESDQLKAVDEALDLTSEVGNKRIVFEILPDGSFLNEYEVSSYVRKNILRNLAKQPFIQKIAFETRVEYCKTQLVTEALNLIRPDQKLELYFGLETTDEFISSIVHDKGYAFADFKEAVHKLRDDIPPSLLSQLEISAYNIIKPAYLTETEAIELAIKMAEDVHEFFRDNKIPIPFKIKYEPSVISKGTLQAWLYHQFDTQEKKARFTPLSYFSVAEILARLEDQGLHHLAKFGQRDDIDTFTTVSMIPNIHNDSMFSRYDFMVYNAVQRYNSRHLFRGFLVDMLIPVKFSTEFEEWENEVYGETGKSQLARVIQNEFEEKPLIAVENNRLKLQKQIWTLIDEVECSSSFSKKLASKDKNCQVEVENSIKNLLTEREISFFSVKSLEYYEPSINKNNELPNSEKKCKSSEVQCGGYQTEIILFNEVGDPQSVWIRIPLDQNMAVKTKFPDWQ